MLKFNEEQIKILAYACFVHDVGNLYLPKSVLYKRSAYTDEENELMRTHTKRGAEFLQSIGVPPAVVLVALQHPRENGWKWIPAGAAGGGDSSHG